MSPDVKNQIASKLVSLLLDCRDDIGKLPLPAAAKSYVRRKGLASMRRQPRDYLNMVKAVTGVSDKFSSSDAVGSVQHVTNRA